MYLELRPPVPARDWRRLLVRLAGIESVLCLGPAAVTATVFLGCASPSVCSWLSPAVTLLVLTSSVLASYLAHELAHLAALARAPGVSTIRLAFAFHRLSVEARGSIPPQWRIVAAASGPLIGASVAGFLSVMFGQPVLGAVGLLHAAMLLPLFGDGRALVGAVRAWRSSTPP